MRPKETVLRLGGGIPSPLIVYVRFSNMLPDAAAIFPAKNYHD